MNFGLLREMQDLELEATVIILVAVAVFHNLEDHLRSKAPPAQAELLLEVLPLHLASSGIELHDWRRVALPLGAVAVAKTSRKVRHASALDSNILEGIQFPSDSTWRVGELSK